MGADGYIVNPNKPVVLRVRCHECGKEIDMKDPAYKLLHMTCRNVVGNMLVDIDIENYEAR